MSDVHESPAVSATEVQSLSTALDKVFQDARSYLNLVKPAPPPPPPGPERQNQNGVARASRRAVANTTITYAYNASIAVNVDTDWSFIDGFTLNNAYLELSLNGYSATPSEMNLSAYVEATCTIGKTVFNVSGDLPDLQSNRETEFTFTLTVANLLEGMTAEDFLNGFTAAPSWAALTKTLDTNIASELSKGDASCISSVSLILHRKSDKSFYLKEISFKLEAGFNWQITHDIILRKVSFSAKASRDKSDGDWEMNLGVQGTVSLGTQSVTASAIVSLADASVLTLQLDVTAAQSMTGPQLMDLLLPDSSAQPIQQVKDNLPPTMISHQKAMYSASNPLSAKLVFTKPSAQSWELSTLDVKVFLYGVVWRTTAIDESLRISVGDIFFSLQARLVTTKVVLLPSAHDTRLMNNDRGILTSLRTAQVTNTYDYKGEIGGVITLLDNQFRLGVKLAYDSKTRQTTFHAILADGLYGPLNLIAADQSFDPLGADPSDLLDTADAYPAPASSPLSLDTTVQDPLGATQRGLWMSFTDTQLTRAIFKAHFQNQNGWSLTSGIALTDLGILFDIRSPQVAADRTALGYVYGRFKINSGSFLAFVAGTSTPKAARFLVGLSIDSENSMPGGPLLLEPATVMPDPAIVGQAVPADGWGLPTFPLKVNEDVLTQASARLLLGIEQSGDPLNTKLSFVKASAFGKGTWDVYAGVQIIGTLGLSIVVETQQGPKSFVGHAELTGSLVFGTDPDQYDISFTGRVERGPNAPDIYSLVFTIAQHARGSSPTPTTIATLAPFGGKSIDQSGLGGLLPDGYPVSPNQLISTASNSLISTVTVQKDPANSDGYALKRLTFMLEHVSASWQIINKSNLVVLAYASLALNIDNPSTNPKYGVRAYGLVNINNYANLEAEIMLVPAKDDPNKPRWCRVSVSVSAGTPGQGKNILDALISGVTIPSAPQSWPVDASTTAGRATADIYFKKDGSGNWQLTEVDFRLYGEIGKSDSWNVGPSSSQLPLGSIFVLVSATKIETAREIDVSFCGIANLPTASFLLAAKVQSNRAMTITAAAAKDLTSLFGVYVKGGLMGLESPVFDETGTTLDTYRTGTFARADLSFVYLGNTYELTELSASINAVGDWTIVSDILKLTNLSLAINWQPGRSFEAELDSIIAYKDMYNKTRDVGVQMKVDRSRLSLQVNLQSCSIFDIFYIATAGAWRLDPGFLPEFKSLYFEMNWDRGMASFDGKVGDFNLINDYPNIAGIQDPRIWAAILRGKSLIPFGGISGDAVVLGIHIPVSYDLPNGPLRIFGLDVESIYKMCKKLYELCKDLEWLCQVMLDIVGALEAIAVGLALILLGAGISAVWKAIKKIFGGSDDDDSGDNTGIFRDLRDRNFDLGPPNTYTWVYGGPGLSNGIAGEDTHFTVYPKDRLGRPLDNFDISQLKVEVSQNGTVVQTIDKFSGVTKGGYLARYKRPQLGQYSLAITYDKPLPANPPLMYSYSIDVTVTDTVGRLSLENTLIQPPPRALAGVMNYALIRPYDSFNNPRRGYDESDSFAVEFEPPLLSPVTYTYYNDCVQVGFVLPPAVGADYKMNVSLLDESTSTQSFSFTSVIVVDPSQCVAGGPGLCSGKAGESPTFTVTVNDQMGNPWTGDVSCRSSYRFRQGDAPTVINLVATQSSNIFTFTCPRPADQLAYVLSIYIDDRPLAGFPTALQSTKDDVGLSVANSLLTIDPGPYYNDTSINAMITAFDNQEDPTQWRNFPVSSNYTITTTNVDTNNAIVWPLVDGKDGTCSATISGLATGNYRVTATSPDGTVAVVSSPILLEVVDAPYLADARCYGPGLSMPTSATGTTSTAHFDILPVDQYGNIISISSLDTASLLVFMDPAADAQIAPRGRGRRVTYETAGLQAGSLIRVTLNGTDVASSPFVLSDAAPTQPSLCRVSSWVSHQVETISSFIVTAVDSNGNPLRVGGDKVALSYGGTSNEDDWPFVHMGTRDNRDGTYVVRYIPTVNNLTMQVLVNEQPIQGSPFTLPAAPVIYTPAGLGYQTASLGVQAQFQLFVTDSAGNPVDDSTTMHTALLYPKSPDILDSVPVSVVAPVPSSPGVWDYKYTVPSTMTPASYLLRVLVNYRGISGSPFTVAVDDAPPPAPSNTATVVGVDQVYFPTADTNEWAGSFQVVATLDGPISGTDLTIVNQPIPQYVGPYPAFYVHSVSASGTTGTFVVQTRFLVEGTWPVTMAYKQIPIPPPTDMGNNWLFYSCDAGKALATYLPRVPTASWGVIQQDVLTATPQADSSIKFFKSPSTAEPDAYASIGWTLAPLDMGQEMIYHFRIRWNTLSGISSATMSLPSIGKISRTESVLLRYTQGRLVWSIVNDFSNSYTDLAPSLMTSDGQWHYLCLHMSPNELRVYEDGHLSFPTSRRPLPQLRSILVGFQVHDAAASFDVDVADFVTCPGDFHADFPAISRPREILFNPASQDLNKSYFTYPENAPIPVRYSNNSSLQIATTNQTGTNYTTSTGLNAVLGSYCAVQYRFRINRSDGYESKITVVGNIVMRVLSGGCQWQLPNPWGWTGLSNSTAFTTGGDYVDVFIIVCPDRLTLFENGQMNFEFTGAGGGPTNEALFSVQHYDYDTGVDVELQYLRVVSSSS